MQVAQAICCQILANEISEFLTDAGQLPKYGPTSVTAYCISIAVFIKCLCMLRLPLTLSHGTFNSCF